MRAGLGLLALALAGAGLGGTAPSVECSGPVELSSWPRAGDRDRGSESESPNGDVADNELSLLDARRGHALRDWALSGPGGSSKVVVLAGNAADHWALLHAALSAWNPYLADAQRSFARIDARACGAQRTCAVERAAMWLRDRAVGPEVRWSVVFVANAAMLHMFDVNELMRTFQGRARCVHAQYGLDVACGRVLVALSTDFGRDKLDALLSLERADDKELDPRKAAQALEQAAHKELRLAWRDRAQFGAVDDFVKKRLRLDLFALLGSPGQSELARVVQRLDAQRQARRRSQAQAQLQATATASAGGSRGSRGCDQDIDTGFLGASGFVGQRHVVGEIEAALRTIKAGFKTSDGPTVFLFAGPAGLGKTYLAKLIASAYNCGRPVGALEAEGKFLQIDMVNYQDEKAVDAFVDPAPGLVGTGIMADAFAKSEAGRVVVLLDEIEKSHPSLLSQMLLPMLDNNGGSVQSKKSGLRTPTKDAIFILTTNCFGAEISALAAAGGFSSGNSEKKASGSGGFSGASSSKSGGAALSLSHEEYSRLVATVADLMRDPERQCVDAHPQKRNPFASGPLWRRLKAGHSLANRNGMFVFLPPSPAQVDALVEQSLEDLSERLPGKHLYYSKQALRRLQREMAVAFDSGTENMGTVSAFVENHVTRAVPLQLLRSSAEKIMLYVSPLSGHVVAEALDLELQPELAERPLLQSKGSVEIDPSKGSAEALRQPLRSAPPRAREPEQQREVEREREREGEREVEVEVQSARAGAQEEDAERSGARHYLRMGAVAVAVLFMSFYAPLPLALKMLLTLSALLYYAFPDVVRQVAEWALWAFWILFEHADLIVPGGVALWLLWLIVKAKWAARASSRSQVATSTTTEKQTTSLRQPLQEPAASPMLLPAPQVTPPLPRLEVGLRRRNRRHSLP